MSQPRTTKKSRAELDKKIITRMRNSTQPAFRTAEPQFFICPDCQCLFIQSRPVSHHSQIACCGNPLTALIPENLSASRSIKEHLNASHQPKITISGGFSANVATVEVGEGKHPMTGDHAIRWIYLHTFMGGQIKYLKPEEPPSATFSLSGDDAFVYCDRNICKMGNAHCLFNCKRGFAAYAYCNQHGLWKYQF